MTSIRLPKLTFWRVVLLAILAAGAYATFLRFTQGLKATTALNDQFPWGIWIGFDVMCGVALAAGGFTMSAVVYIFHVEKFRPIIRPSLLTAFLGYLLVVVGLMFDLGRPYNVWHPLIMWNPHSVMFEVGWCVTLYTTVLALEFSPMVFERLRWNKLYKIVKAMTIPLVIIGVLLSTLHQSSLGTLYLIVPQKLHALWYSPLLPVYFYISAIALGCAMTVFESYLSMRVFRKSLEFDLLTRLGTVAAIVLLIYLGVKVIDLDMRGALALAFQPTYEGRMFLTEMLLGVIAPIILLLIPKVRNNQFGLFISSVMVVSGFIMNRINVSITGMDRSSGTNYFPSWTELSVTASIVVAGFILFGLAVKYLNIFSPEEMKETVGSKRAELPVPALLQQPLRSATTLSFALGAVFLLGAAALAFDGVRLRVPAKPLELSDQTNGMDLSRGFAEFNAPDKIAIKMGKASPGQVVFDHARHLDAHHPSCVTCHTGQFMMLKTSTDIAPDKKMTNCGSCHDGIKAVSVRDEKKCDSCHTAKPQT